ncbi:hypothetical protein RRF57_011673 [Xylaria bambusicola]|uniref:Uncharacterized protein n=1 Tax=Xylaria bambusicola TaxID=326684 RepID=A0AAN7ZDA2_9PEZI
MRSGCSSSCWAANGEVRPRLSCPEHTTGGIGDEPVLGKGMEEEMQDTRYPGESLSMQAGVSPKQRVQLVA